ncbi:PLD nuclease N-terminal domain-containing protein [Streptomyces sp. V4-01]|uniref:PLD nuclease N-terminal domain-containing protein n=1 Tax=Actinacidiphila polyblastidii TaxID=3110430 RepID=A0ABU7P830_9ACTN|nr:PLD nuclease N-terminal domain-containing protein [Streptomyces sp. V4-01]
MLRYAPYLVILALWIYALVDCIGTPERQVRFLPKLAWLMIIVFFGWILIGPLAWLVAGRFRYATPPGGATAAQWRGEHREDARPEDRHPAARRGRHPAQGRELPREEWIAPDDNPEFLRSLGEANRRNRGDDAE